MNYIFNKLLLLFLFCSSVQLSDAQDYASVEDAVTYLNEIFEKNEHSDEYKIVSVDNDLIQISTIRLKTKDVVQSMEKDGKTLDDYPATRVVKRNDDGSALVESKSAMSISTLKKFKVEIGQSEPYEEVNLLYFQNILALTWDYNNEKWFLSTWNYLSFSFKSPEDLHQKAFEAWQFLFDEVVKREDLMVSQ